MIPINYFTDPFILCGEEDLCAASVHDAHDALRGQFKNDVTESYILGPCTYLLPHQLFFLNNSLITVTAIYVLFLDFFLDFLCSKNGKKSPKQILGFFFGLFFPFYYIKKSRKNPEKKSRKKSKKRSKRNSGFFSGFFQMDVAKRSVQVVLSKFYPDFIQILSDKIWIKFG